MSRSPTVKDSSRAAHDAIVKQQAAWALRAGLRLETRGWIVPEDSDRNLVVPLSAQDRLDFGSGAGNELDTKMRAPHSSSALAFNCFAAARESTRCLQAFARLVDPGAAPFTGTPVVSFERKRPTGWGGIPPHLDAEIAVGKDVFAVESKMKETYGAKTDPAESLAPYLKCDEDSPRWEGMESLRRAAECLSTGEKSLEVLDAAQLIKHGIGLLRAKREEDVRPVALTLLWFDARELTDAARPSCEKLLEELDWLRAAIADKITLTAMTHQDLIKAYRATVGGVPWVLWLEDRYLRSL